jgi:hypothetical protein
MQKSIFVDYKEGLRLVPLSYEEGITKDEDCQNFRNALMDMLTRDGFFSRRLENGYPVIERFQENVKRFVEVTDTSQMDEGETLKLRFCPLSTPPKEQSSPAEASVVSVTLIFNSTQINS